MARIHGYFDPFAFSVSFLSDWFDGLLWVGTQRPPAGTRRPWRWDPKTLPPSWAGKAGSCVDLPELL
eukprot:11623066-Prorocentrum_lima.AAC.1